MPWQAALSSTDARRSDEITSRLQRHIRWQRRLLQTFEQDGKPVPRFLVLRPGDKFTVCTKQNNKLDDVRAQCFRDHSNALPRSWMHWDDVIISRRRHMTRPIPGLGNIALSLVSAAVTAIVSRRVLLLENASTLASAFGSPLDELLIESSGWGTAVSIAQRSGSVMVSGGPS